MQRLIFYFRQYPKLLFFLLCGLFPLIQIHSIPEETVYSKWIFVFGLTVLFCLDLLFRKTLFYFPVYKSWMDATLTLKKHLAYDLESAEINTPNGALSYSNENLNTPFTPATLLVNRELEGLATILSYCQALNLIN